MSFISITPPVNQHGRDNILRLCTVHVDDLNDKLIALEDAMLHLSDWSPSAAALFFMTQSLLMSEVLVKGNALAALREELQDDADRVSNIAALILNSAADFAGAATLLLNDTEGSIASKGVCQ